MVGSSADDRVATRRSPFEIRELLLAAAERVTAREGRSVSLGAIAAEAGVSRSALYRHFSNREELLTEAAVAPFIGFLDDFRTMAYSQINRRDSVWDMERSFVASAWDYFAAHRDFISTVFSDRSVLDEATRSRLIEAVDAVIEDITTVAAEQGALADIPAEHVSIWTRLVLAFVSGASANGWWLFPQGTRAWSRDAEIDYVTGLILYGIQRPPGRPE